MNDVKPEGKTEYVEYKDRPICVDWTDGEPSLTDLHGNEIYDPLFCEELKERRNG